MKMIAATNSESLIIPEAGISAALLPVIVR